MSRRTNYHYENIDDEDDEIESLRSKVSILRNVSIQIGEETRDHNRFLKRLDERAETVWDQLMDNFNGVKKLARSGSNRLVFYLLAFALFVIIVIYLMSKRL